MKLGTRAPRAAHLPRGKAIGFLTCALSVRAQAKRVHVAMTPHLTVPGRTPWASHLRHAVLVAFICAAVTTAPAGAQTPAPTIKLNQRCYRAGQGMTITGDGYTPGGKVQVGV